MNITLAATHRTTTNTQVAASEQPLVTDNGVRVSIQYEDYLGLDPVGGASRVWYRLQPGNGTWQLLTAGMRIATVCNSKSIELLPDLFDQQQVVRLICWGKNEDIRIENIIDSIEDYAGYDSQVFVDTVSLINSGVGRGKPGSAINSILDYTTRWVTLDGSQGAAFAWIYDGETYRLAQHGKPIPVRVADSSGFVAVAPCVNDLTSIVCLIGSKVPVRLPPITSRTIVHTPGQSSSGTTDKNFIIDYRLPSKTNAGVGIVEYYISGAGNLILDAVYDGNSGTAPTFVNISTTAVGAGHGYITTGLARSQKVSFRTSSAVNLTVTCKDMGAP